MHVLNHVYALILIMVGWLIFNGTTYEQISVFFKAMFSFEGIDLMILEEMNYLYLVPIFILALIFSTPVLKYVDNHLKGNNLYKIVMDLLSIVILLICIMYLVNDTYNPFIYFRF